jgi:hypothetical protein
MKQVNSMPTEGQFVAVWENARIWSGIFLWKDGLLFEHEIQSDEFILPESPEAGYLTNAIYFVAGEEQGDNDG